MPTFTGLPGVRRKRVEGVFASTPTGFVRELRKHRIVSAAGDDGSVTVWRDDKGALIAPSIGETTMGMGPWAQADFMRDIERGERARFRRAVNAEIKKIEGDKRTLLPDNEVLAMLDRIKGKVSPRRATR